MIQSKIIIFIVASIVLYIAVRVGLYLLNNQIQNELGKKKKKDWRSQKAKDDYVNSIRREAGL